MLISIECTIKQDNAIIINYVDWKLNIQIVEYNSADNIDDYSSDRLQASHLMISWMRKPHIDYVVFSLNYNWSAIEFHMTRTTQWKNIRYKLSVIKWSDSDWKRDRTRRVAEQETETNPSYWTFNLFMRAINWSEYNIIITSSPLRWQIDREWVWGRCD